jgi:hypothetical protein
LAGYYGYGATKLVEKLAAAAKRAVEAKLSARLFDHPDSITNVAAHQMEIDLRLTGQVCDKLAGLRFQVSEIAETVMTQAPAATDATCSIPGCRSPI